MVGGGSGNKSGGTAPEEPESLRGGSIAADIFISYASRDAAVADAVVEALERVGLRCWIAPRDVVPGALYADEIVRAINSSQVVVLVLSAHAIASPHVGKEIERASSKRRRIVAIRTDSAELTPGLEYFLSESQWIEIASGGIDAAAAKLVAAVRRYLDSSQKTESRASADGPVASRALAARRTGWMMIGGVMAVALGLAYFVTDKFWTSRQAKTEQTAATVASSSAGPSDARTAISPTSIAVLPFVDMSEKQDQEYFADGIAEEVLDRLAKLRNLKVVGHTSSFRFKGKSSDAASTGALLGVAYLLEGSVRRVSGRVRVAAQLVEARTSSQRWNDHFDSDLVDVLKVQDSIAAGIARALQITVEVDTTSHSSVKSAQAIDMYLRGLQSQNRQSRESSQAAVADFEQALRLDPAFAPAAAALAATYVDIGSEGWLPPRVAFERSREAAVLALRLDPDSASPHVSMAAIHTFYDWDWPGAERELHQAFALSPNQSFGAQIASQLAAARGQWDEARQRAIEAVELDPLSPTAHMILGWNVYLHTGQFAEAEESIRRGLQIAPNWGTGQYFLGESLMLQGRHEVALIEFQKETLDDGQLEGASMAYFLAGRKTESDAKLAEAIRHNGKSWPSEIARVYAFRGDKDRAFEWLDRAYEFRDEDLYIIKDDPLFKNLTGDPRYKIFLRKMNLPE